MSETLSYILFGIALALLILSAWRARRQYVPGRLPIIPWMAVQYVALVATLLFLAHLVTIWTGHPLIGRR